MQGHARLAAVSAAGGILLLLGGLFAPVELGWFQAHGALLLAGTILPALTAWHHRTFAAATQAPHASLVNRQVQLYAVGAFALAIGWLLQPSLVFQIAAWIGLAALIAGAVVGIKIFKGCKPEGSLVDVDKDPLTKGDDASFKHIKMAHMFLPAGLLLLFVAWLPFVSTSFLGHGFWLSGIHVVLVGFGLLSLYGIGHYWVPRYSGVPAIAAGAIKGELHSTMPAMILLPAGFLTGWIGLVIAGGAFAFLGFFTYMGVLGANIMRNKSPTHRVTPEFVYIPWTFAGIFWLVSGVLMGVFLTVVPDILSDRAGSLRSVHIHINLLGGVIQLLLAWFIPGGARRPVFDGMMKSAFYGFNVSVTVAVVAMLGSGSPVLYAIAAAGAAASLVAYAQATGAFMKADESRSA